MGEIPVIGVVILSLFALLFLTLVTATIIIILNAGTMSRYEECEALKKRKRESKSYAVINKTIYPERYHD